jgi:IMP dehydrogenase
VLDRVKWVKKTFPQMQVVGGNIATRDGAKALVDHGADAVKVGIGPGSICTTRIVAGVGVPQVTAIQNVADALASMNVPCIADGGIRYSGDIAKALAAGASSVMLGSPLRGSEEAPGDIELFQGRSYKAYRGHGLDRPRCRRARAIATSRMREQRRQAGPRGVEGRIPYKGPATAIVGQLMGGVRASHGLHRAAAPSRRCTPRRSSSRSPRRACANPTSTTCQITKEAPNYPHRLRRRPRGPRRTGWTRSSSSTSAPRSPS